jgi:hypothetical protein
MMTGRTAALTEGPRHDHVRIHVAVLLRRVVDDSRALTEPLQLPGTSNTLNSTDGIYNSLSSTEKNALTLATTAASSGTVA